MSKYEETTKSTPLPNPCEELGVSSLKDLKEKLRKCKAQIEEDQMQIENWKKKTEKLQTDVTDLDKASNQTDQISEEYKKAYEDIKKEKDNIIKEYDCWKEKLPTGDEDRRIVDGAIGEIDGQINNFKDDIKILEKCEGDLPDNGSLLHAEVEYKKAFRNYKDSEENFEKLKNQLKKINEYIKKGKESHKLIGDELNKRKEDNELNKKYERNAYFYFTELKDAKEKLDKWIIPPDKFKEKLREALGVMEGKKIESSEKEGTLNERKTRLDSTKKKLETVEKSRNKDILERINE